MPIEQEHLTLIEYLKLIPDFVWVLFAVVVGAMLSWLPLRWQLKHDSKEKEKERKMSLRRDVYLSVAANIGQLINYLTNFYDLRVTSPEGFSSAIQQIDIIGSNETITAYNQFNDFIVEAYLELIPKQEEICSLEERSKFLIESVKISFETKKFIKEYKEIYEKKIKLTYELAEKCRQKAQAAEVLLTPFIVAVRKELDTPFDEVAYRGMMEASHSKWERGLEKYIASMKDTCLREMQSFLTNVNHLTADDTNNE